MQHDPLAQYIEELAADEKSKEDSSVGFDTRGNNKDNETSNLVSSLGVNGLNDEIMSQRSAPPKVHNRQSKTNAGPHNDHETSTSLNSSTI